MVNLEPKLATVESYADAFRDLVNDRVGWKDAPASKLRLSKNADWSFVCVAMDILGDASLALHDFLQFGLDGPTKYDNTGEKYLRLYGLLSAAYVQQQAALKLHNLMGCSEQKTFKARANKLEIRALRHQLASHSLDCRDLRGQTTSSFVPVRIDLGGFKCSVAENRGDRIVTYDLRKAVLDHCNYILDLLDAIYAKSYKTLFKSDKKKRAEYQKKLEELREEKAGAIVLRRLAPGLPRIVLVPAEPCEHDP